MLVYKKGDKVMRRGRTVLEIAVKSSVIGLGCLLWSVAGSAWAETADAKVLDQPPKGFFVNLALAQGYKESLDSYQTERFKPVNPGTAFKSDVEADRKSTRLNSSHQIISYAVFCLKKKKSNN